MLLSCGLAGGFGSRPHSGAAGVADLKVNIREWAVPTKGAHPHDPAVGGDGALWFTEQMVNKIGRLDPKSGSVQGISAEGGEFGPAWASRGS